MEVNSLNVGNIEGLARLTVQESQKQNLQKDLEEVLSFAEKLQKVDITESGKHLSDTSLQNITRVDGSDYVPWQNSIDAGLRGQAPATEDNYFVVERVISR